MIRKSLFAERTGINPDLSKITNIRFNTSVTFLALARLPSNHTN